jgi:uncharacterized protein YlzI (FlbEa/FlbD family)
MIEFLLLQALDGHNVYVNKAVISTISEPRVVGKLGTDKFNCIVGLTNGKYIAVLEKCETIRDRLKKGE